MAAQEFRIDGDSPAKGDLMFWYIAGYECVGRASAYELRVLSKSGIITPKQILGHAFDVVIGFDDVSIATFSSKPISTIHQDAEYMGELAVELLPEALRQQMYS